MKINGSNFDGILEEYVSLKNLSTFKIGGIARYVFQPSSVEGLIEILKYSLKEKIPYEIVGNCSKVLFPDGFYNGIIIRFSEKFSKFLIIDDGLYFSEAGLLTKELVFKVSDYHYSGLEFLYDIPASTGGAVYMNASNNYGETKNVIDKVKYIDINDNFKEKILDVKVSHFSYRKSPFTGNKNLVITGVYWKLKDKKDKEEILNLCEIIRKEREKKFPIEYPNCGSIFKRPEGHFAGTLIEKCGLKGFKIGDAMVSEKHSGFIINLGNATSMDVKKLISYIENTVYSKTNIKLEREIIYID